MFGNTTLNLSLNENTMKGKMTHKVIRHKSLYVIFDFGSFSFFNTKAEQVEKRKL